MSELKHTPGPWALRADTGTEIFAADGLTLMTMRRGLPELAANAQLISAAPEMLTMLLLIKANAIDMRGDDFNLTTEQWAQFHAVIAKATGAL